MWMQSTRHLRHWHRLSSDCFAFFAFPLNRSFSPLAARVRLQRSLAPADFASRSCFSFSACCSACAAVRVRVRVRARARVS